MEMRAEVVINAPAEDAWAVVGERFGEIGEWASAITESVMDGLPAVGQVRTCQIKGFGPIAAGVIRERLTEFNAGAMSLSYEAAAGMPRFITGAVSRWSVDAGPGSACTVRIHATVALRVAARRCLGGLAAAGFVERCDRGWRLRRPQPPSNAGSHV